MSLVSRDDLTRVACAKRLRACPASQVLFRIRRRGERESRQGWLHASVVTLHALRRQSHLTARRKHGPLEASSNQNGERRAVTLLEPALILGLGAVIALVIVSILMAMLGLNELVV